MSEKHFKELATEAQLGEISKTDFVNEIDRTEFIAIKKVRDLLAGLQLGKSDKDRSYYYPRSMGCPDDYEKFVVYRNDVLKYHNANDYERQYDALRAGKIK